MFQKSNVAAHVELASLLPFSSTKHLGCVFVGDFYGLYCTMAKHHQTIIWDIESSFQD